MSIDQNDFELMIGETSAALTATVDARGGAPETVRWSSGDASVAAVDGDGGTVLGVSVGEAEIIASSTFDVTKRDAITVSVVPTRSVESVTIDQGDVGLLLHQTVTLTATVDVRGGVAPTVTWESSAPSVATVDAGSGLVTGHSVGSAAVTATSTFDVTKHDTVVVTVADAPQVVSVEIDQVDVALRAGETQTMTASVVTVGSASEEVIWGSSDASVATIGADSGVLSAVAGGTSEISATSVADADVSDSTSVSVFEVLSVTIDQGDVTLHVGEETTLTASVDVLGDAATSVTWSSSHAAVATVDPSTGRVMAESVGTAGVTASSVADPRASDSVVVTVTPAPAVLDVRIDQGDVEVARGESRALTATVDVVGGASAEVAWTSSDAFVASVGAASGVVATRYSGVADITATSVFDPSKVDTVEVAVPFGTFQGPVFRVPTNRPTTWYQRDYVAVDRGRLLVPVDADPSDPLDPGSVAVFRRSDAGWWEREATLEPTPRADFRAFGKAVELRGQVAVVLSEHANPTTDRGYESTVHVFEGTEAGVWTEHATLLSGDGIGTNLMYEISLALGHETLAVGLPSWDPDARVHVYHRDHGGEGAWGHADVFPLPPTYPEHPCCPFGTDVDVSEDGTLIAVANSVQTNDNLSNSERVFIYEQRPNDPTFWSLVGELGYADLPSEMSTYVEIDADTLAVSEMPAWFADSVHVYIFDRNEGGPNAWGRVASKVVQLPPIPDLVVEIAQSSVRLTGDTIAVGIAGGVCWYYPDRPGQDACGPGEVHVFSRGTDAMGRISWSLAQIVRPDVPVDDQGFGLAVALGSDARRLAVGSVRSAEGDQDPVYVFER